MPELLDPLEPEVDLAAMATGAGTVLVFVAPVRAVAAAFDAEDEGPEASERLTAAIALMVAADVWDEMFEVEVKIVLPGLEGEGLLRVAQLWVLGNRC